MTPEPRPGAPPPPEAKASAEAERALVLDRELAAGYALLYQLAQGERFTGGGKLYEGMAGIDADLSKLELITQRAGEQPSRKLGPDETVKLQELAAIRFPVRPPERNPRRTAGESMQAAYQSFQKLATALGAPAIEARSTEYLDSRYARVQGQAGGRDIGQRLGLMATELGQANWRVEIGKRAGQWDPRLRYDRKTGATSLEFSRVVKNPAPPRGRRAEYLDPEGKVFTVSSDEQELQNGW